VEALKNVVIVESDKALRESLVEQLCPIQNLYVNDASNAKEAFEYLKEKDIAVLIIAINLPNSDCLDICKFVKTNNVNCSIILLGNTKNPIKNSKLENLGIETYLTKPFRFSSLLRLIMIQLQKHERICTPTMTVGKFAFYPAEKTLLESESGKLIRLTEKEVSILQYMLAAEEKLVEREVLLNKVWGYNSGISTHTLETHIYRLRQKVEPNPSKPQFLITQEGGYILTS